MAVVGWVGAAVAVGGGGGEDTATGTSTSTGAGGEPGAGAWQPLLRDSGGNLYKQAGGGGVSPEIMQQAANMVRGGGKPEAVRSFLQKHGMNKSGAWCGMFAASVVKEAGGTPPKNPEIASNWRNYGTEVSAAEAQPGDVAVRRGVRTGSTGSHVAFVGAGGLKGGKFERVGGNQGGVNWRATSGYQFFRGGGTTPMEKSQLPAGGTFGAPGQASDPSASKSDLSPGGGGGGAAFLASKRERFAQELRNDPELRTKMAALIHAEGGKTPAHIAESMMNRAELSGKTLRQIMFQTNKRGQTFYGPINRGELPGHLQALAKNKALSGKMNAGIDEALRGSNYIQGNTDQGMRGDPNYEAGGIGVNVGGNRFNDWGVRGSKEWRLRRQAEVAAADRSRIVDKANATPQSKVAVNINSNGTKADAKVEREGPAFAEPQVKQTRQMQTTESSQAGTTP